MKIRVLNDDFFMSYRDDNCTLAIRYFSNQRLLEGDDLIVAILPTKRISLYGNFTCDVISRCILGNQNE